MMVWSRLRLAGMFAVAASFLANVAAAAPSGGAPGYSEVTAPDEANSVAIVPRPEARHMIQAYAIETIPDPATRAAMGARVAPQVTTSLPAGPPLVVEIRFDARRAGSASRANAIALDLERQGIAVAAVGPASSPVSDGVGFAFIEDAAAAADLARRLPEPFLHTTPVRIETRGAAEPAPGTIEITLGGERRTS